MNVFLSPVASKALHEQDESDQIHSLHQIANNSNGNGIVSAETTGAAYFGQFLPADDHDRSNDDENDNSLPVFEHASRQSSRFLNMFDQPPAQQSRFAASLSSLVESSSSSENNHSPPPAAALTESDILKSLFMDNNNNNTQQQQQREHHRKQFQRYSFEEMLDLRNHARSKRKPAVAFVPEPHQPKPKVSPPPHGGTTKSENSLTLDSTNNESDVLTTLSPNAAKQRRIPAIDSTATLSSPSSTSSISRSSRRGGGDGGGIAGTSSLSSSGGGHPSDIRRHINSDAKPSQQQQHRQGDRSGINNNNNARNATSRSTASSWITEKVRPGGPKNNGGDSNSAGDDSSWTDDEMSKRKAFEEFRRTHNNYKTTSSSSAAAGSGGVSGDVFANSKASSSPNSAVGTTPQTTPTSTGDVAPVVVPQHEQTNSFFGFDTSSTSPLQTEKGTFGALEDGGAPTTTSLADSNSGDSSSPIGSNDNTSSSMMFMSQRKPTGSALDDFTGMANVLHVAAAVPGNGIGSGNGSRWFSADALESSHSSNNKPAAAASRFMSFLEHPMPAQQQQHAPQLRHQPAASSMPSLSDNGLTAHAPNNNLLATLFASAQLQQQQQRQHVPHHAVAPTTTTAIADAESLEEQFLRSLAEQDAVGAQQHQSASTRPNGGQQPAPPPQSGFDIKSILFAAVPADASKQINAHQQPQHPYAPSVFDAGQQTQRVQQTQRSLTMATTPSSTISSSSSSSTPTKLRSGSASSKQGNISMLPTQMLLREGRIPKQRKFIPADAIKGSIQQHQHQQQPQQQMQQQPVADSSPAAFNESTSTPSPTMTAPMPFLQVPPHGPGFYSNALVPGTVANAASPMVHHQLPPQQMVAMMHHQHQQHHMAPPPMPMHSGHPLPPNAMMMDPTHMGVMNMFAPPLPQPPVHHQHQQPPPQQQGGYPSPLPPGMLPPPPSGPYYYGASPYNG